MMNVPVTGVGVDAGVLLVGMSAVCRYRCGWFDVSTYSAKAASC